MSPPIAYKTSSSNHRLYHEALRLSSLYVCLAFGYGASLVVAALQLAGVPVGFLLGLQDAPLESPQAEGDRVRSGSLSLCTAGVGGLLMAALVRRCCRLDRGKAVVVTNWHDLFKYMHLGRTITAAMTAVLTWRGLNSLKGSNTSTSEGGSGLDPTLVIGAAVLSMAATASMNYIYFRVKAVHADYDRLTKRS